MNNKAMGILVNYKRVIMPMADLLFLPLALWLAFSLRLGELYQPIEEQWWLFIAAPLVAYPIFVHMGLYRAMVRFMESRAFWQIVQAMSLSVLLLALVILLADLWIPRSTILIYWLTGTAMVGGSRMAMRWIIPRFSNYPNDKKRILIYGAGGAGIQLAAALRHSSEFLPLGFLDDDPKKIGNEIGGLKVHNSEALEKLIPLKRVEEVLIATPSATISQRRNIIDRVSLYPVNARILPGLAELAQGRIRVEDLREIKLEDCLGREIVPPDLIMLASCIRGKSVMVTGAGGSIGSELCRQILKLVPKRIVLFERSESALYEIKKELDAMLAKNVSVSLLPSRYESDEVEIVDILGSVLHQRHLEKVCKAYGVQTIYHAAAYKHVPMVEYNPVEAVHNNIFGTHRVAMAAMASNVSTFVMISTDKAVRPTNIMGATKRFGELILQGLSVSKPYEIVTGYHQLPTVKTKFCIVRFGNVLGSSGSVVPLFQEQIKKGGPITVTDENIIRYFMTIPEAAQLVLQAGAMARGGDVFVLDMGDPVRIIDLAKRMIQLAGMKLKDAKSPEGDIEIKVIGMRPGEKLYEELLIGNNVTTTEHQKIMRAEEEQISWKEIERLLQSLMNASMNYDCDQIKILLQRAVKGYIPRKMVVGEEQKKVANSDFNLNLQSRLSVKQQHTHCLS